MTVLSPKLDSFGFKAGLDLDIDPVNIFKEAKIKIISDLRSLFGVYTTPFVHYGITFVQIQYLKIFASGSKAS